MELKQFLIQANTPEPRSGKVENLKQLLFLHRSNGFSTDDLNVVSEMNTTRFNYPIAVNTNGIQRAEKALDEISRKTGIRDLFNRVQETPENGIVFLEGGARGENDSVGPYTKANVSRLPNPSCGIWVSSNSKQEITGCYYIKLGSHDHPQGVKDYKSWQFWNHHKIATHETLHALGLFTHVSNVFCDETKIVSKEAFEIVKLLYSYPSGTNYSDLKV